MTRQICCSAHATLQQRMSTMIVCPDCGSKRCRKAAFCEADCNDPDGIMKSALEDDRQRLRDMLPGVEAVPYRTPACDDHLEQNESDECPWCRLEQYEQLLHELAQWFEAYPVDVFTPLEGDPIKKTGDYDSKEKRTLITRASAMMARHMIERIPEKIRKGLKV